LSLIKGLLSLLTNRVHRASVVHLTVARVKDYAQFAKLRLASLVVFSAFLSYLLAAGFMGIDWFKVLALVIGGFLVTGASNGINQIIEKDLDKLMHRTRNRPLAAGRMSVSEGAMLAAVMGVIGIWTLWYFLNPLSGVLGALALLLYTAIYTPLKRITPFAVLVGAFPGAIPPMLGYVAETGTFGLIAGLLFAVQFMWQFPHFWAIAWKLEEDYNRGGFSLLPSKGGRDKASAFQILIYSLFLIPVSLLPVLFMDMGWIAGGIVGASSLWFFWKSVKLFHSCSDKDATALMFASFIYLPVVQLTYLIHLI